MGIVTDLNEALNALSEARAGYRAFVDAVDADLRVERVKRLAERRGAIMNMVAEAYVQGASKRAIMSAYGTKDFRTIQGMLDSMENQIALLVAQRDAEAETPAWLEIVNHAFMSIRGVGFDVIPLEGDDLMLSVEDASDLTDATRHLDGVILSPNSSDEDLVIYNAYKEAIS